MNNSKDIRNSPLAVVGIYPPPFGGVGIHLKRMIPLLDKSGLDYVFYNTGPTKVNHPRVANVGWSLRWYLSLMFTARHKVIHFHTYRWYVRVAVSLLGTFRKRTILFTGHSYRFCEDFLTGNGLRRWVMRRVMRKAKLIAVNEVIRDDLLKIAVTPESIRVIPDFIPPPRDAEDEEIPEPVRDFCKVKTPILMANGAFAIRNGKDVYGLGMLAELMEDLLPEYPHAGLVVYIGGAIGSEEQQFAKVLEKLEKPPLKSHVLLYSSRGEFYPALRLADVFLRPTSTDGDAVSVREALYLGVPCVASDVVWRPEGVNLFRTGNRKAFKETVFRTLEDLPAQKRKVASLAFTNPGEEIIKLYSEILADHA